MRGTRGFTLAELLVALAVMAMIGLMLGQSTATGLRLWERSRIDTPAPEAVALRSLLRQALEQTVPPAISNPERTGLSGTSRTLSFRTEHRPDSWRVADPIVVELEIAATNLLMQFGDELYRIPVQAGAMLRYLDGDNGEWVERWSARRPLPSAVEIVHGDPKQPRLILRTAILP